jgi:hypothetical protein
MAIIECIKGALGYEETAGITHHCANMEKGASGSNGTTPRTIIISHIIGRGSQEYNSTILGRMCRIDQRKNCNPDSGHAQIEDHAGANTNIRSSRRSSI